MLWQCTSKADGCLWALAQFFNCSTILFPTQNVLQDFLFADARTEGLGCTQAVRRSASCAEAAAAPKQGSPAFTRAVGELLWKLILAAAAEWSGGFSRKLSFWKLFCLMIFFSDHICSLLKCTKGMWPDTFSMPCVLAEPCKQAVTLKVNFVLFILFLFFFSSLQLLKTWGYSSLEKKKKKKYAFLLSPYFFHYLGEKIYNYHLVQFF